MKINIKKGKLTVLAGLLLINSTLVLTSCTANNYNNQNIITENHNKITIDNETNEIKNNDEIIISYFEETEKEIENIINSDNENIKQKISEKVVILIDFLFYDGEIKGIKLDEITDETKDILLDIILKIDTKVEEKIPDYKTTISDKCSTALNWLKEKANNGIVKIDDFLNEKIDNYDKIKEGFNEVIENTKDDFEEVKDIASDGFSKIKEYYENWRENVRND